MAPKRKAEDAEKGDPFGSIKSLEAFNSNFPHISFSRTPFAEIAWDASKNSSHKKKVYEWIKANAAGWIQTIKVLPHVNNEATLYAYVFAMLKSIVELNNSLVVEVVVENELTDEMIDSVVDNVVDKRLSARRSSLFSTEGANAVGAIATGAMEDISGLSSSLNPYSVNTADKDEVRAFVLEIERWLYYEESKGRVEFTVEDGSTKAIKCIIEVKLSLIVDKDKGFYQCSAYMAAAQKQYNLPVVYGAYADFDKWVFMKLENNVITRTNNMGLFDINFLQFSNNAYRVFSYLLEICHIPVTVDMGETVNAVVSKNAAEVDFLLEKLSRSE